MAPHSDDLASAVTKLIEKYESPKPVNVGVGSGFSIAELALKIAQIVGFTGPIEWDSSKPDGTPRKLIDISKLQLTSWSPKISLDDCLEAVCKEFVNSNRALIFWFKATFDIVSSKFKALKISGVEK